MTKQFKIGEYAIGGIIKVTVNNNSVNIEALDYYSKKNLPGYSSKFDKNERYEIDDFLNELTSCYYADKIIEFIYK
jgi:hypothetical protein